MFNLTLIYERKLRNVYKFKQFFVNVQKYRYGQIFRAFLCKASVFKRIAWWPAGWNIVMCYPDTLEPCYHGMSAPDTSINLPESLRVAPSIKANSCEALWSAVKIWSWGTLKNEKYKPYTGRILKKVCGCQIVDFSAMNYIPWNSVCIKIPAVVGSGKVRVQNSRVKG